MDGLTTLLIIWVVDKHVKKRTAMCAGAESNLGNVIVIVLGEAILKKKIIK